MSDSGDFEKLSLKDLTIIDDQDDVEQTHNTALNQTESVLPTDAAADDDDTDHSDISSVENSAAVLPSSSSELLADNGCIPKRP